MHKLRHLILEDGGLARRLLLHLRAHGSPSLFVCAVEREQMLDGDPARQLCREVSHSEKTLLPSDLDGPTLPPAGAPNYLISQGPVVGLNGERNTLAFWRFKVDWAQETSTLSGPFSIQVDPYTNLLGTAVPQPAEEPGEPAPLLETHSRRLMHRFVYRNFAGPIGHESLLVSHAVDADPSAGVRGGVRWYELRSDPSNPSDTPTAYQQGTHVSATDPHWRWMSSIAMDGAGNIALGYSISSTTLYPSIRFAGRLQNDPLGTLRGEGTIVNGSGSILCAHEQSCQNWGDYTSMSIDPIDDCTFYYTNQYLQESGPPDWYTQIAALKPQGCT